jgi:hypothetical protein
MTYPETSNLPADTLLAINEGVQKGDAWYPVIHELNLNGDKVERVNQCGVDFPLPEGDKKGWEGAEYLDRGDEGEFILGICEGNHCEVRNRSPANGNVDE